MIDLTTDRVGGSFRDPSGYVFKQNGTLYRHVALSYRENYDLLISSGLYQALVQEELLVAHDELPDKSEDAYKLLKPQVVDFISYPYEWCFSQLKDAALTTLLIQERALERGMTLKDASSFNIQFVKGKPTLIDTLSFEKYEPGEPWVAYRQFCQHFLAPLALMSAVDVRLNKMLLQSCIDGVDLEIAAKLMPWKYRFNKGLFIHLFMHAGQINKYSNADVDTPATVRQFKMPKEVLHELIKDLARTIRGLTLKQSTSSEWSDYYGNTNYTDSATSSKESLVAEFIGLMKPTIVWDLGANIGNYSRIAVKRGAQVISMDIDALCVERNYLRAVTDKEQALLPIVIDLAAPTPAIGWSNDERATLKERGPADLLMALALVHHICLGNNVPFGKLFEFLAEIGRSVIIEFVPKEDSQVKRMLASRKDIFVEYDQMHFEAAFSKQFEMVRKEPIPGTQRTLYLLRRN